MALNNRLCVKATEAAYYLVFGYKYNTNANTLYASDFTYEVIKHTVQTWVQMGWTTTIVFHL